MSAPAAAERAAVVGCHGPAGDEGAASERVHDSGTLQWPHGVAAASRGPPCLLPDARAHRLGNCRLTHHACAVSCMETYRHNVGCAAGAMWLRSAARSTLITHGVAARGALRTRRAPACAFRSSNYSFLCTVLCTL